MRAGRSGLALTLLSLVLAAPCHANGADSEEPGPFAGRLTLRIAPEYTSGDYGLEGGDTDVWYVPLSARYELSDFRPTPYAFDRLSFKLTVPFVHVDGPGGVVTGAGGPVVIRGKGLGGGGGPGNASSFERSDEQGLGDILVAVSYRLLPPPGSRLPWLSTSATVKTPTASQSRNLGTGEPDYTLFTDVYQPIGRFGLYAGGGYRFMGDPDGLDLSDRWLASVGVDVELSSVLSAGLTYDYREAAAPSAPDAHELSPWLSLRVADRFGLEPYAIIGAANGSPDYGVGIRLSWSMRTRTVPGTQPPRDLPRASDQAD